jgi:outer membrane lipoprotein SlyB
MKPTLSSSALLFIAMTALGGCASNSPQQPSTYATPYQTGTGTTYGAIESIQVVHAEPESSGAGAIMGGLVGGLLGNQVGSGNGRTAATVAGAAGGALLGNNIEKNRNAGTPDVYQVRVRLDNGASTTITQDDMHDLRVGSRVRIVDGHAYRYGR